MNTKLAAVLMACVVALSVTACEKKGPMERAGEEVDEAVDTLKQGKESTGNKLDDAGDKLSEGARDATDELKGK